MPRDTRNPAARVRWCAKSTLDRCSFRGGGTAEKTPPDASWKDRRGHGRLDECPHAGTHGSQGPQGRLGRVAALRRG